MGCLLPCRVLGPIPDLPDGASGGSPGICIVAIAPGVVVGVSASAHLVLISTNPVCPEGISKSEYIEYFWFVCFATASFSPLQPPSLLHQNINCFPYRLFANDLTPPAFPMN